MTGRGHASGAPSERPEGDGPAITVRGDAEGVWHRVHPLTPFVRSWLLLVALVWGIGNAFMDDFVSSLVKHEPVEVNVSGAVQVVGLGLALAVLCGALGVLIALGLLSWWFIRYQITEDHVRFRSGWLFRTQRQARLDRVQGIDIERRFLPRILGLASLKFDVADGGSSILELSYLGREHAQQLRRQLLVAAQRAATDHLGPAPSGTGRNVVHPDPQTGAPARGTGQGPGRVAPWALAPADGRSGVVHPGAGTQGATTARRTGVDLRMAQKYGLLNQQDELRRVFIVPTGRVLLGLVCSPPAVVLVLIALITAGLALWFPEALIIVLPSAIAPLLGVLSGLYTRLERSWGFTLSEVPSGVRTRAGLFNERSSTIPTGRVQALQVTRPLLWRSFGGHRVVVTTAGKGGAGQMEDLGSVVLPVGTWENVQEILHLVLPLEHAPRELVREGLSGVGDSPRFTANPRRSRWLDPVTWRRNGFALDDSSLVLRWGRITRHACVVPHHKTQSVAVRQGPVERRMGLSGVAVHVTPGAVTTALDHLDVRTARELQWRHAQLTRAARERDAAGGSWAALPPEGSASEV